MKKSLLCLFLAFFPSLWVASALPQANVRITPATGDLYTTFTIDASSSTNENGQNTQLLYQFRASPQGLRSPFQSSPIFKFRAKDTGSFNAQVLVLDQRTGGVSTTFHHYRVREELQRDIRIRASNLNPIEGETVIYTVTVFGNNLNRNQLQTRWDFNSDGIFETPFRTGLTGTYSAQVGVASPTVEVKFPDGQVIRGQGIYNRQAATSRNRITLRDRTPVVTSPSPIVPPILEVTPSPTNARENTTFTFDGSRTKFTAGSYLEWTIEGRTIRDQKVVRYRFKSPGTHPVTLRHCINRAEPVCVESKTQVTVTAAPLDQILDITWTNLTDPTRPPEARDFARITTTDRIRLNVQRLGQQTAGQTFRYRWDFEGDGFWDTGFAEQNFAEHTYNQVGQFVAVVEAQPQLTSPRFQNLTHVLPVYVHANKAPQGSFTVRNAQNYVGERVWFTAQITDQQSDGQVEVRFDSDADGVWDSDFRHQQSWWWEYDTPGTYQVRMQLRDPQGAVKQVSQNVTILPMPAPQAQVKVSHRTQTAGQTITLDASASTGRQLYFRWSVRGQPHLNLIGARTNLRLPAGDYTVRLRVIDRLGVEDVVDFPVSFTPAPVNQLRTANSPAIISARSVAAPSLLSQLPGVSQADFIVPAEGIRTGPSPFVVDAGTARPGDGFVSGMRPGR